jgi:hypothetical protein
MLKGAIIEFRDALFLFQSVSSIIFAQKLDLNEETYIVMEFFHHKGSGVRCGAHTYARGRKRTSNIQFAICAERCGGDAKMRNLNRRGSRQLCLRLPHGWIARSVCYLSIAIRRLQTPPPLSVASSPVAEVCVAQFAFACVIRLQLIHETAHQLLHRDAKGDILVQILMQTAPQRAAVSSTSA